MQIDALQESEYQPQPESRCTMPGTSAEKRHGEEEGLDLLRILGGLSKQRLAFADVYSTEHWPADPARALRMGKLLWVASRAPSREELRALSEKSVVVCSISDPKGEVGTLVAEIEGLGQGTEPVLSGSESLRSYTIALPGTPYVIVPRALLNMAKVWSLLCTQEPSQGRFYRAHRSVQRLVHFRAKSPWATYTHSDGSIRRPDTAALQARLLLACLLSILPYGLLKGLGSYSWPAEGERERDVSILILRTVVGLTLDSIKWLYFLPKGALHGLSAVAHYLLMPVKQQGLRGLR